MTIREARQFLMQFLAPTYDAGEAATIADWVLESLTGLNRNDRVITHTNPLSPAQLTLLNEIATRLAKHEPVQYVLNECWFCGFKFYVDKSVLIPRPETEELVEWIISNLKFPLKTMKLLDIGTGSGCIPIALKRKIRKADIWSCDISEEALAVARRNADELGAAINLLQLNFLDHSTWDSLPMFDLIISNPPYIPERDKAQMQPNVLNHEPHIALFVPDNDPLLFYKAIAIFGQSHLAKNGNIFLEIHEDLAALIEKLFLEKAYDSVERKKDMQGKERMLKISRA